MIEPHFEIITAHSYSPKFRNYCVGAYVLETHCPGLPQSHRFKVLFNYTIDENKEQARKEAIARIMKNNARHPSDMKNTHVGRVSLECIQGAAF